MSLAERIGKPMSSRIFQSTRAELSNPFIAMRHGQAAYTPEEDRGGDNVEGTLTEKGKQIVVAAADEIVQYLREHNITSFTVFTSPKRRCLQTTEIVIDTLTKAGINCKQQVVPDLRDVKVIGPTDTMPNSYARWEANMLEGENWFRAWKRKAKAGMQFYEGEESPDMVRERVRQALFTVFQLADTFPFLMVCHEEVLGAIAEILEFAWDDPTYGEVWYINPANKSTNS